MRLNTHRLGRLHTLHTKRLFHISNTNSVGFQLYAGSNTMDSFAYVCNFIKHSTIMTHMIITCRGRQSCQRDTFITAIDKISVQRFSLQTLWNTHTLILLHYKAITVEIESFMQTHDRNPLFKYATQSQHCKICNIYEFTN